MEESDVESRLTQIEQVVRQAEQTRATMAHRDDTDRSFIARVVVLGFGATVLLVVLFIFAGAVVSGGWHDAMQMTVEILKSVLLPVVTLILGYYFGRAAKG